jgi:hypothetical protein
MPPLRRGQVNHVLIFELPGAGLAVAALGLADRGAQGLLLAALVYPLN